MDFDEPDARLPAGLAAIIDAGNGISSCEVDCLVVAGSTFSSLISQVRTLQLGKSSGWQPERES